MCIQYLAPLPTASWEWKTTFDLAIRRNPDESNYPSNFDEEVAQQATTTFDWMSIIEDGGVRQEKARKCVKDMRTILDNRRLVCIAILVWTFKNNI